MTLIDPADRARPAQTAPRGGVSERTLLETALARLDDAALAVTRSAATEEEQHHILGVPGRRVQPAAGARRVDPAAVDELLQRAIRLRAQVSQPKTGPAKPPPSHETT